MIHATFLQDNQGIFLGYTIKGHAGSIVSGQNILCAAISSLVLTNVNYLETIKAIAENDCFADEIEGGIIHLDLTRPIDQKLAEYRQLLVDQLFFGLQAIAEENPDDVRINIKIDESRNPER
ncbi:ribosomal-processing cysteine protease Prp [Allofustis seminis]|uniref:ribosomal-processing cysteine protease Prp n=1 Tax=Allofustis seminis TaxID=166939 RepID=UPI00037A046B|nr:ribosomal-processing cysteine protease Prp [Allofustis seminis]